MRLGSFLTRASPENDKNVAFGSSPTHADDAVVGSVDMNWSPSFFCPSLASVYYLAASSLSGFFELTYAERMVRRGRLDDSKLSVILISSSNVLMRTE